MVGIQGFRGIQGFTLGIQGFSLGIHGFTNFSVFSACFLGIHRDSGIHSRDSVGIQVRDSGIQFLGIQWTRDSW